MFWSTRDLLEFQIINTHRLGTMGGTDNIIARSALTFGSAKLDWPKSCSFVLRSESNCFLGRGYGGGFNARRRWRFDTSIFRISKVDPPINPLRNRILTLRDPVFDHLFAHFLNLWKPPNWRSWRHDQNKSAIRWFFGAIPSASTANVLSVLGFSGQSIALRAPAVHGVSSIIMWQCNIVSRTVGTHQFR